ncbi:hypothetical protein NP233_g10193 [Leucocoprinus birnbaumii]|uniref:RING-type domain-containing protein n=1 Tax=Leucocoprinus birnbaumii TaxID=56174 RepID=A0AAD5VJ15_9AGAR|nr:hypothetical protein NP233_g10193 [Leucocoprinus birnbaumii]
MKPSSHGTPFLVMPKAATRTKRTKRNGDTPSSGPSRLSPATSHESSSLPLPTPTTLRNLQPRVTRSRTSSRLGSQSASNSRSGSILSTATGDSGRSMTRNTQHRKKRRLAAGDAVPSAIIETAGSSSMNSALRPEWANSDDENENVDQLEYSDIEEIASQARTSQTQATQQSEARLSSYHRSLTPPPLTALSSTQNTIPESFPSSSTSAVIAGPSGTTTSLSSGSGSRANQAPLPHETPASPVSSPSLMKIINQTNISPGSVPSKRKRASLSPDDLDVIEISEVPAPRKDKGKGKAKAISLSPTPPPAPPTNDTRKMNTEPEPLSEYTCPICFFPPSNATLTPCGHVCCGSCLFTAVKTTLQRGANMGMAVGIGENVARCPVCRAIIPGWDGKGAGVIGLKVREIVTL